VRLIVMSNHIILDPEIFGPVVSSSSEIIRGGRVHSVYLKSAAQSKSLVLQVQGARLHGLELVTNMRSYEFSFQSMEAVQQARLRLQEMCKKAEEKRERQRQRYFESPHMHFLLERCSRVHTLRKGQTMTQAATTDSLFVVSTGQIKLKRDGAVFRQIFEGECFGATEFVERTVSGRFTAEAAESAVVLELPPDDVHAIVRNDPVHACLLFWTLCQVMDVDFREAMEEMYPGTWSRKTTIQRAGSVGHRVPVPATDFAHESGSPSRGRSSSPMAKAKGWKSELTLPGSGSMSRAGSKSPSRSDSDDENPSGSDSPTGRRQAGEGQSPGINRTQSC